MKQLWPIRTGRTVVDRWSIAHLAFWIFAGSTMAAFGLAWRVSVCAMLLFASAWELFERNAEVTWPKIWKNPESLLNAVVGDILLAGFCGLYVGYWICN